MKTSAKIKWTAKPFRYSGIMCCKKMNEQLQLLTRFHSTNVSMPDNAGVQVRKLIDKIIELKQNIIPLQPREQELLPSYNDWIQFGETIRQLSAALEETGADAAFAEHPFSKLNDTVFTADNPLNLLDKLLQQAKNVLTEIQTIFRDSNIATEHSTYLEQIKNLVQDAVLLEPLAAHDNLQLVDNSNKPGKEFDKKIKQQKQLELQHKQAQQMNSNWKNKLSEQDVAAAIEIASRQEKSFFNFLNGGWRRLKTQLQNSYDFSQHQVKPAYSSIFATIAKMNMPQAMPQQIIKPNCSSNIILDNIDITWLGIEALRNKRGDKEIDYLLAHPDANNIVKRLYKLNNNLYQLESQLQQCLYNYNSKSVHEIQDELESLAMNADGLQDLLPALRAFAAMPAAVKNAFRDIPAYTLAGRSHHGAKNIATPLSAKQNLCCYGCSIY